MHKQVDSSYFSGRKCGLLIIQDSEINEDDVESDGMTIKNLIR